MGNFKNGQKIGAIVSVEGLVSHKTSSYSVVQDNPKKAEEGEMSQIGTVPIPLYHGTDKKVFEYSEEERRGASGEVKRVGKRKDCGGIIKKETKRMKGKEKKSKVK